MVLFCHSCYLTLMVYLACTCLLRPKLVDNWLTFHGKGPKVIVQDSFQDYPDVAHHHRNVGVNAPETFKTDLH